MRTVKIVNHNPAEATTVELSVRGGTIVIDENREGDERQLQFDLCSADDVDWIILAMQSVSRNLRARSLKGDVEYNYTQITKEEAALRFAELRREINEREDTK